MSTRTHQLPHVSTSLPKSANQFPCSPVHRLMHGAHRVARLAVAPCVRLVRDSARVRRASECECEEERDEEVLHLARGCFGVALGLLWGCCGAALGLTRSCAWSATYMAVRAPMFKAASPRKIGVIQNKPQKPLRLARGSCSHFLAAVGGTRRAARRTALPPRIRHVSPCTRPQAEQEHTRFQDTNIERILVSEFVPIRNI
ncbi:hypothetical protein CALVIDRAFT_299597 [Calocera viscosa TUFC12733]|uniref:Uncharacterized protein n=1 Tax=Calocera viscosa (strain TUFC12733) TaxID=1330018 RepID=A0A167IH41_CALVF|nr:hypothetical protein CALVIDRAFT_299597 [Calocera viscosa TUFC12733]